MYCTSNNDRSVSMAILKMAQCAQVFPNSANAQLLLADIKKLHLEYLRSDRSETNIRFRQKLEEEITRYLTIVHHKEKFPCALFLEILRQTVETKPDFDAYQVASAFKALESYAFNLIGHPWRKEYHVVRLYCGYFKYHVDRWLINAKYVLAMMGYEQVSDMVMELQEPIDPDQVIMTSLNCLIAAVECQIMTQIYEAMKGRVSWQDIAQVRRHHVGDVTKACQLLSTPKHEKSDKHVRSYSVDRSRLADYNWQGRVEKLIDVPSMLHDGHSYSVGVGGQLYTHINPYNQRLLWESVNNPDSFVSAVTNGHDMIPDAALVPKSADEHMAESYSLVKEKKKAGKQRDLTRDDSWSYVDRGLQNQGYGRDRSERGEPLRKTSLLLNKQKSVEETLRDMTTRDMMVWAMEPLEQQNTEGNLINFERSHPWGQAAEALYRHAPFVVYPTAGYTRNAHFPTTDVALAPAVSSLNVSNVMQGIPTSKMHSSNAVGRNVAVSAALNTARKDAADAQVIRKSTSSRNSLYDNVPAASSSSSTKAPYNNTFSYPVTSATSPAHYAINPGASNSETVRRRSQQQGNYHTVPVPRHPHGHHYMKETTSTQVQTDVVDGGLGMGQHRAQSSGSSNGNGNARWSHVTTEPARASSEERDRKERNGTSTAASVASGRWPCRTCTYFNAPDKMICEMCSRSRDAGPEGEPLTSGGLHCEKCTLVNEKGAKECVACSTSLENSPTYV